MSFNVKIVRHVTLPLFKFDGKTPSYLRFDGAMFTGKIVDDKKEPPTMANVTNMATGEMGQIIVGAVLKQELTNQYPNDSYVGKTFEIVKSAPEGARKYSLWNITEVEVSTGEAEQEAPAKSGKK